MSVLQARPGFFADRERTGVRSRGKKATQASTHGPEDRDRTSSFYCKVKTLFILSLYTEFSFRTALRNSRRHVGLTVNK